MNKSHTPEQLPLPEPGYLVCGLALLLTSVPLIYFASSRGATEPKDFLAEIILFALLAFTTIKKRPVFIIDTGQNRIVGLFFLFYLGSAILAQNYYWSLWAINKWAALLILYLLAQQIGRKQQDTLILIAVVTGALVSGFALVNYYGYHFDAVIHTLSGRARMISTFGNRNYLSAFIAPLIPLNIYLILLKPHKKSFIPYACFTLIFSASLYAKTRGALLGLLISLITLLILILIYQRREWFKARYRHLAVLGGITLLLLVLFSGTPPFATNQDETLAQRLSQHALFEGTSSQARFMLWGLTADMIHDHPLKGIGIGNYGFAMPGYQKNFLNRPENWHYRPYAGWALYAHNQYLQFAAEGGLIPMGLFLVFLSYLAVRFFKRANRAHHNLAAICLLCSLETTAFHALVSFPLSLMSSSLIFWFVAGRINRVLHPEAPSLQVSSTGAYSLFLHSGLLIVLSILMTTALLKFASDRYLAVGHQQELKKELAAAEKSDRRSLALNPFGWRSAERLGAVISQQGRYQEASKYFIRARRNAQSDLIDNEEGLNFVRQNQYSSALQAFIRGRRYFPANFNLTQNSGLAAKALADPLFYGGAPQRAVELSKEAFLFLEKALTLTHQKTARQKISYYLISLSNNLFNQSRQLKKSALQSRKTVYFTPPPKPLRHIVEEIRSGANQRVRLFCSSPRRADARIPATASAIQVIPLGSSRLYQYTNPAQGLN